MRGFKEGGRRMGGMGGRWRGDRDEGGKMVFVCDGVVIRGRFHAAEGDCDRSCGHGGSNN